MFAYRKVNVYTCTTWCSLQKWILLTLAEVLGIRLVKLDSELIETKWWSPWALFCWSSWCSWTVILEAPCRPPPPACLPLQLAMSTCTPRSTTAPWRKVKQQGFDLQPRLQLWRDPQSAAYQPQGSRQIEEKLATPFHPVNYHYLLEIAKATKGYAPLSDTRKYD